MFSGLAQRLPLLWFRRPLAAVLWPLLPVSWFFLLLASARRALYRRGVFRSYSLPVPVVIVGNLTVGGSGKTPLVLWLVDRLRTLGWHPGIISRGFGRSEDGVQAVVPSSLASEVGDEPLLLARRSGVPVFVGRDRVAAGRALLAAHSDCNVIISDDGLQHYRLQRSVELAVFDSRGVGNGHLLPVGPLREPLSRLATTTAVVRNGAPELHLHEAVRRNSFLPFFDMRLLGSQFCALHDQTTVCDASAFRARRLYAVAGIGNPGRFFSQLRELGLAFEAHPFPDHHRYTPADFAFASDGVLLMTEKDAVKCGAMDLHEAWVLPVEASVEETPGCRTLLEIILEKLNGRTLA